MTTDAPTPPPVAPVRIDPRTTRALAIAAVLSLVIGLPPLMMRATGYAVLPTLPGNLTVLLVAWLLALAIGLVAAFQARAGGDLDVCTHRTRRTRTLVATAAAVLLTPFAVDPLSVMFSNATAVLTCVPSTAFGLFAVHRMQRHRRMPAWLTVAMFGWGATIAAGFAGLAQIVLMDYWFHELQQSMSDLAFQALPFYITWVHVGIVEEFGKACGVAMAYVVLRRHIDGVVSGIVLGAAVGLGFNFIETVLYMSGPGLAFQYWGRQTVTLLGAHTAFSAVAGAGFGVARQLRDSRLRRVAIACGFLVAASGHFAANSAVTWFDMAGIDWFASNPTVSLLIVPLTPLVITQGPLMVMYLFLLRRGLRRQATALATHLPAEARTGLGAITPAEASVLLRPAQRLRLRVTMLRRHGLSAARNLKRLHAAQLDLAIQRWHRARQEVDAWAPNERVLRERVWHLKNRQAALLGVRKSLVTRMPAVFVCALAIVALSPTGASAASCGSIRYQAGEVAASPADDCSGVATSGSVAVGAVAVSAAFAVAFASYLRGAISAADVEAVSTGLITRRGDEVDMAHTAIAARHVADHPVVTYQRQRALGDVGPARPIHVPDVHLPAVTEALAAWVRAYAAHEELGLRQRKRLGMAVAAGVETSLAGMSGPSSVGIVVAKPADVARYAASINHPLPPAFRDSSLGGAGMWYASHAEKQQLYLHRDMPIGITLPMCADCYRFFINAAMNDTAITGPLVTADPNVIRIFHKDGTVEGYWHNGLRAPEATPQYVHALRAQNLIP
jgi:RsiW-degrading membrane proteinase PrsW (M82 family)